MTLKGGNFLSVLNVNTNKINKLSINIFPVYIEYYGAIGKLGPI